MAMATKRSPEQLEAEIKAKDAEIKAKDEQIEFGPLAGTSWMHGFLDGREDGFRVGLKLGLMVAIQELERLIKIKKPSK